MTSHRVGSARRLHPRGVAEAGRGQDRVGVTTGDRDWCSANREAAASAEATWCLLSLVCQGAQQAAVPHDSVTGAIVSARDAALSLPPKLSSEAAANRATRVTIAFCESDRPDGREPAMPLPRTR